jgi:hypothetical protein
MRPQYGVQLHEQGLSAPPAHHRGALRRHHGILNFPAGVSPSTSQQLKLGAQNMGIPGIARQQFTNTNIYDTVVVSTGAGRQQLQFFIASNNKSRTFSNWQNGNLLAGESIAVTHIYFSAAVLTNTNLTVDSSSYTSNPDTLANSGVPGLTMGMFTLQIANTVVMKNYLTLELMPQFNPASTGIAAYENETSSGATPYVTGCSKIKVNGTPPKIYPDIPILCTYEIPAVTISTNLAITITLGREGTIFSPGGPQ